MAKVYRLHVGQDGTGWFSSKPIGTKELKTIITEGKDVATSIPSPFARVDLVKSAFRWVAENGVDGNTAHHKLVSDSLDVAQLFYASQKFASKIQIVAWNPKERLKDLVDNGKIKHSKFASTIQLFWNQDSVPINQIGNITLYNFESVNRLYFLLNKESNIIIGGTSPATLFFASPDVKKATVNLNIKIGQDKLFDDEYASLVKRETSFVEYIYTLAKQPNFADYFPEVFSYLQEIKKNFPSSQLRQKVSNFDAKEINNFKPCPVLGNENNPCEILGIPLGIQTINGNDIENQSDFVIKSDFQQTGKKPLILPYHKFSKTWTYTTNGILWDENTKISFKNTDSSINSKLPIQHDDYYWLTIGNFFEDKIIELPYPIDDTKFKTCGSKNHLLPLSPTFFKYFSAEKVSEYLKIEEKSGGLINVELKIPVKGGEIAYKKVYSAADKNIEKLEIHLAVFPFLKTDNPNLTYNIGLLDDRLEKNNNLLLSCYNKGIELELESPITRNPGEGGELKSIYYKSTSQFDLLKFGSQAAKGFVVPILKQCSGNNQINFAIDFGTTNTHIEYKYKDKNSVAFDNTNVSPLWQSLLNRNEDFKNKTDFITAEETFEQEILPYSFSNSVAQVSFPLRTALVYNRNINFNEPIDIIRQANNYLLLEKLPLRTNYLDLHTDIKWSNYADPEDEKKVESYIEFLATLVYYKTLLLGGNASNTTITWFYPVSMDNEEVGVFFKVWKEVYEKIFQQPASDNKLKGVPESIAPYFYYNKAGLCLSIDIGGGSSDIAVFDKSEDTPELISSFKFAGNAIFGDGYTSVRHSSNSDRNGFVNMYKNDAIKAVEGDDQKKAILDNILDSRKNSADFSSFLFALEQDNSKSFSYSRLLGRDKKLKLTILVYFGAIAYYSANLLKNSNLGIPKHILLSGMASKTASIIDTTENFSFLSDIFQFIFKKVYNVEQVNNISIDLSKIPKEVTCKGALKAGIENSMKNPPVKFWIGGLNDDKWGGTFDKEKDVHETPKYGEIDDLAKSDIKNAIINFYSILDEYKDVIRLEDKIEPSAYKLFQEIRESDIENFLIKGIRAYHKEDDYHIEESLFFYPLIGILNELSYALSEKQDNDE